MTVRDLIIELSSIKNELQEKEVYIISQNGSLVRPEIKFKRKDKYKYDIIGPLTKRTVESIILM